MSVSRGNGGGGVPIQRDPNLPPLPGEYDGYEVEEYNWDQTVPKADLSGGTGVTHTGDIAFFEVLDGLDRNEVAELVTLVQLDGTCFLREEGSAGTTPGLAIGESTLSLNQANINASSEGDANLFGGAEELLAFSRVTSHAAFNDTVNGTGGGGGTQGPQGVVAYPFAQWFGSGPIFDRNDQLEVSGNITTFDLSNQDVQFLTGWRAYYAVHEVETGAWV